MNGMRLWLVALTIQSLLIIVICGKALQNRRSSIQQQNLPSKGGWRPVFGSSGLSYSPLGTAPLHAPSYKIPLLDLYPSSARPVTARDVTKLTSIAQSYKPTTLRTVSVSTQRLPVNQPINSYLNPFSLPNNGGNHYKFVQSYPVDSIFFRNQHNSYAARPVLQKQQTKQNHQTNQNHQYHNNILQQLTNIQPIQFGQYSTGKPVDIFGKPNDAYPRQDGKRPQSAETEIFKPEVFKLGDADTPSHFLSQSVKTAQQQSYTPSKYPINQYGHPFQDTVFPPSILGSFGSFGIHSVKGRDPVYPTTKTTFLPPQSTKQTFNSFHYSPSFKSTPALFATSTPKLTTAQNYNYFYSSTLNDLGNVPTPQTKLVSPAKIDPNAGPKFSFKPSPQDPFVKNFQNIDYNKISTYSPPVIQTSSAGPLYNDYGLLPQNTVFHGYKNQNTANIKYDKPKQKVPDNLGLTQQVSQQYTNAPGQFDLESSLNALSQAHRPSYAVVENTEDVTHHASVTPWTVTPQSYAHNQNTNEPVTSSEHIENIFEKPTTVLPDVSDEYSIVTESENNNENSHYYDSQVDNQSRRPLGDDFEPIGKNKLRDYYYKVSTPTYTEHKPYRRTKKPSEAPKPETTTFSYSVIETTEVPVETLPTLPPNRHFKRPSTPEPLEKDKIRKRNKIRRRRPSANRNREETNTRKEVSSTDAPTTITEDIHTVRPRVRPIKLRTEPTVTTPSDTTELTTSALPTTSPTKPTVIKKKLVSLRRPSTTPSDRFETTTQVSNEKDNNRESPIMKISSRPQLSKAPLSSYEFRNSEIPDYSHKQDEKDTPTSDVSVSIGDTLKTTDTLKEFSFHRDVRPVEIKEVTTQSVNQKTDYEITTYAPRAETSTRPAGKVQRPRLKNKFDRPKFSVKDYRNRLNSTTSTTEKVTENTPKARPQRKNPYTESIFTDIETTTERKKFTPKEPRHKLNRTENNEQEIHSRQSLRQKQNSESVEASTQRMSSRIRNGQRRPRPTEETSETSTPTVHHKRPLRKRIHDSETGESVQDISVTESSDHKNDMTEKTKSESAIMKIADKKHHDPIERLFEHSKRVSDLTLAASKDYNTPGMFKTVSSNSRRIPSYFTIATDDPILPIEAFFPQLNQKKES